MRLIKWFNKLLIRNELLSERTRLLRNFDYANRHGFKTDKDKLKKRIYAIDERLDKL